ncbi:MAG: beta-galactosidase [Lachnospiraceae bacterium]|nr:beta-galactosidase [Lachnospiraceae bacterium]
MQQKILYGGDYYPEQWLKYPDILAQDVEYMKEAGINTVTLGVFAWSMLEPEEGRYEFGWLRGIMDRLYESGISVILATPSGARPKWLSDRYPEVLRVREDGRRNLFGGRHNHCYTSPVYREKVRAIDMALAREFGSHPAVILWHISNELGGECHCPLCQQAFRDWLKKQYRDIEELNDCWCTTFWSHRYQSFEQIEAPSSLGEKAVHGLNLDWKRFVTAQTADFASEEIRAVREGGGSQPATMNLMYDYSGLDYDELAKQMDTVSWDSYPLWHKQEDIRTAMDNGMQHDFMRSLKKKPFLLMESCPSATNWQGVSKLKKPGMLAAASLQALAHGSDSVLYFQIRQSRGSSEKLHGAVIDHYGGRDTRVFQEVKSLGGSLKKLGEIAGSRTKAEAAVIYDVQNRWALEDSQGPRNKGMHLHEAAMKSYQALKKLGMNVDVISQSQPLEGYRFVAAPILYLFRDGMEEKIRRFVEAGGCFVLTYWSGISDRWDRCFLGGTPYGLTDVFGIRRTETDALYDQEENRMVSDGQLLPKGEYVCRNLCDLLELKGAEPILRYGDDFYAGSPAATVHAFGAGKAVYVGADGEQRLYDELYARLAAEAGVETLTAGAVPEGIEVCSRCSEKAEYVFVQNYRNEPADIRSLDLKGEILYGGSQNELGPYETLIVRRQKSTR